MNLFTNSAAMWDASEALPPFPKIRSFLPSLNASAMSLETSATASAFSFANFSFTPMDSSNILSIFCFIKGLCLL